MLIRSWRDAETAFDDAIDAEYGAVRIAWHTHSTSWVLKQIDPEEYRERWIAWLRAQGVDTESLTGQPLYW